MIDYNAAATTYDNTRTHSDEAIDRFSKAVPLGSSTYVLDFGCGTGNYLARIHQRYGCQCFGVEPSDAMRSLAQAKLGASHIVQGDHQAIPFPSGSIDFAYMTDVIHHVPDLPSMFRELMRVLKPGGTLCIITESHAQIEGRFYNRYFPSLAGNEKRRYPDVQVITTRAQEPGFAVASAEIAPSPPRQISEEFLRNVTERNWSMFRLLSEEEFSAGLQALRRDAGSSFDSSAAGTTFLWFRKSA